MIKDISGWKIDDITMASGTREKYWISDPSVAKSPKNSYLFKLPKENTGEIWAEKISADIGSVLGLETMEVSIAKHNDKHGLLLTNFLPDSNSEFFDGGDLIQRQIPDFDSYSLENYTLENVMASLEPFNLRKEMIGIIIFDALIANQDRHCENWGIISQNGTFKMSPIIDNGASLGYSNSEQKIQQICSRKEMFEAFTNRSKTIIGLDGKKKPKLTQFLPVLCDLYPEHTRDEVHRLSSITSTQIQNIVNDIPDDLMSITHKEWVLKLLIHRRNWIMGILKGELDNE